LLDRRIRSQWLAKGGTTLGERLTQRVKELLKEYTPQPLPPEQQNKLQKIIASAT
jgi:trimethylamine:corrinoid methyltransferase-like protein